MCTIGVHMLCDVTPKEHLGPPDSKDIQGGRDRVQDRGAPGRACEGPPRGRERDDALSKARFEFRWKDQFALSLDPETAMAFHDETLPAEGAKTAHFGSTCRPQFCSMKIREGVRRYAAEQGISDESALAEGMREKGDEFAAQGGQIYR